MNQLFKTIFVLIIFSSGLLLSDEIENSLLWEISKENQNHKSYVFGSMHVKDKRAFEFGDSVLICLGKCKVFSPELSLSDEETDAAGRAMYLDNNERLINILPDSIYNPMAAAIKKYLKKEPDLFGQFRLFAVYNFIRKVIQKSDFPETIDGFLKLKAEEKGLIIEGLEELGDQIGTIDKIPMSFYYNFFKNPDNYLEESEANLEYYIDEDIGGLHERIIKSRTGSEMSSVLLGKRNRKMAERIDELSQKMPCFAVVGAAHLAGDEGILNILKMKGYAVRSVGYDEELELTGRDFVKWEKFDFIPAGFSALFPTAPEETENRKSIGGDVFFYNHASVPIKGDNNKAYYITSIGMPDGTNPDPMIDQFIQKTKIAGTDNKIDDEDEILFHDKYPAREVIIERENELYEYTLSVENGNKIYILQILCPDDDFEDNYFLQKFLDNFELNEK